MTYALCMTRNNRISHSCIFGIVVLLTVNAGMSALGCSCGGIISFSFYASDAAETLCFSVVPPAGHPSIVHPLTSISRVGHLSFFGALFVCSSMR